MERRQHTKPRKIAACFDIETSNNADRQAEPVCYQFSRLREPMQPVAGLTNETVGESLEISILRDYDAATAKFEELIADYKPLGVVPVIMVHNLAFELWVLSPWINSKNADGCSKSTVKPITININDDKGEPVLIFWDTLSFSGKSLGTMGDECSYPKLSGTWDYLKKRTTATELTPEELAYAREDVVVPFAWLSYHLRLTGIDEDKLGGKILTKTSEVRFKVEKSVGRKMLAKNCSVSKDWARRNQEEEAWDDDSLYTMHAGTRGAFTYCSAAYASQVFHRTESMHIYKFDACSMHPFHALAHFVPSAYREITPEKCDMLARYVIGLTVADILADYVKPFKGAQFYAPFRFSGVRLKAGSLFERDQVSSFTTARFRIERVSEYAELNEGGYEFNREVMEAGYRDRATDDAIFAFGKFLGASECVLYLNELSMWEFSQEFDFDDFECIGPAYGTGRLMQPTRRSIMAFNQMYKEKSQFKHIKGEFYKGQEVEKLDFVPDYLMGAMQRHNHSFDIDVENFYLSKKADLNSLYGIEATNEAKPEIILTKEGYEVSEVRGVDALPTRPKTWFQYGSHIVGWSRVHQLIFMELLHEHTDAVFINGDTDSHKIYTSATLDEINAALEPLHKACADSVDAMRSTLPAWYEWYPMDGLGFYECEGEPDAFTASWNKCYMELEEGKISMTIAGLPCGKKFIMPDGSVIDHSYKKVAEYLQVQGWSFDKIAGLLIGYNVSISSNITGMNARTLPKWNTYGPDGQPCAIHLAPMIKTIGDTTKAENLQNYFRACQNNPEINSEGVLIDWPLDFDEPVIINI